MGSPGIAVAPVTDEVVDELQAVAERQDVDATVVIGGSNDAGRRHRHRMPCPLDPAAVLVQAHRLVGGMFRARFSVGGAGFVATLGDDPPEEYEGDAVQPCGSDGVVDRPHVFGHG